MSTQKKYTLMADGTVKDNESNIFGIRPGTWRWEQYQAWVNKGNEPEQYITKLVALHQKLSELDIEYEAGLNKETFEYNGRKYYSDFKFIAGMCLAFALGELPDNHIETWKTADKESDGVTNIYVDLNREQVYNLGVAYLFSQKDVFSNIDPRKSALKAMYNDDSKSAQDILDAEV